MKNSNSKIRTIEFEEKNRSIYRTHFSDAIILTKDQEIILQHRPAFKSNPPRLSAFGGHVENDENIAQGLLREIKEELGANIQFNEVVKLHTLTEEFTNHRDAVHVYFWHDTEGKITGCYEHSALFFANVEAALKHPDIMDYVVCSLKTCKKLGYLK